MSNKLKLWEEHSSWEEAEKAWDSSASTACEKAPIKKLGFMPEMVGITPKTAKFLKWKSFYWMITKDHNRAILKGFLRHPFAYGWRYLKSLFTKKGYCRENDFFFYGIKNEEEFKGLLCQENALFVVGFSYCHKPFECPSGRFTPECVHDINNSVCRQCFIGKCVHALPENSISLYIPTVHYIGEKIFELIKKYPGKEIIFIITACEMTLEMFSDWGNMVGIRGIGVRLSGRICNTMKAFELSERGIKPGLTVVLEQTQKKILDLIRFKRSNS